MAKTRMSMLDLRVQARELHKRLNGARVANIYDINAKKYLIKLAVPPVRHELNHHHEPCHDDDKSWKKVLLLIESGARIHTTNFVRDKGDVPSGFALKLRKHLRTRRLESIEHIGADRVIKLTFSLAGKIAYHLILEFYAGGNIVLTDHEFTIIGLLRVYKGPAAAGPVAIKERYAIESARTDHQVTALDIANVTDDTDGADNVKKVFATRLKIGPELLEHAILTAGFPDSNVTIDQLKRTEGAASRLLQALEPFLAVLRNEEVVDLQLTGTVVTNQKRQSDDIDDHLIYVTFSPYKMAQFETQKILEFATFDDAVDEFFAKIESQRLVQQLKKKEKAVIKKVDKVRNQLQGHVVDLKNAQVSNIEKATAIEFHVDDVEAAILVMRGAMASALDWDELGETIKQERKNGNPVAQIIHSLQLDKNCMTLMLEAHQDEQESEKDEEALFDSEDDSDDQAIAADDERRPALLIEIDVFMSAHANAQRYYTNKKVAASKHDKAMKATERAIKTAEVKAQKELERVEVGHSSVREVRKRFWFEKFHWFISSENFMVVAGRDAQQNEILVRRYLKAGDAYVHADIHGASSVIVKNTHANKDCDIPYLTLTQAGCFAMCRSSAWDSKIVTSAWWVRSSQVSKTAPTGEYLTTGSFVIRGKKNFLPPSPLVMGFGLLFSIDESCVANHRGERTIKSQLDAQNDEMDDKVGISLNVTKTAEHDENDETYAIVTTEIAEGDEVVEPATETPAMVTPSDAELFANLDLESTSKVDDKYDLDGDGCEDEGDEDPSQADTRPQDVSVQSTNSTKYMSARQRKLLRKGPGSERGADSKAVVTPSKPNVGASMAAPAPRGKKSKIKKMKQKYADQDADERDLILQLIGGSKMKEEIVTEDAEAEEVQDRQEKDAEQVSSHQDRKPWMKRDQKREDREIRQVLEDEGVVDLTETEKKALTSLDRLIGKPVSDDIFEFAVPVCAPYAALGGVRMKVKLLPGTLRRGKSFRQAESLFLRSAEKDYNDSPQTAARIKELIREIPESDALQTIMSNTRVQAAGLQEAKRADKKAKGKAKAKAKAKAKG